MRSAITVGGPVWPVRPVRPVRCFVTPVYLSLQRRFIMGSSIGHGRIPVWTNIIPAKIYYGWIYRSWTYTSVD